MSAPGYPAARPVVQVLAQLQAMCAHAYHRFWPDAVSLVQAGTLNPPHLLGHRQHTDAYLFALAVHHCGCLVTLEGEGKLLPRDRRALGGEASKSLIIAASANEIMLKQIGRSAWLASSTRVILGGTCSEGDLADPANNHGGLLGLDHADSKVGLPPQEVVDGIAGHPFHLYIG